MQHFECKCGKIGLLENRFDQAVYGIYMTNKARTMMSAFRMRNHTLWNNTEKLAAGSYYQTLPRNHKNGFLQDDPLHQHLYTYKQDSILLTTDKRRCYHKHLQDIHNMNMAMDPLFPQPKTQGTPSNNSSDNSSTTIQKQNQGLLTASTHIQKTNTFTSLTSSFSILISSSFLYTG